MKRILSLALALVLVGLLPTVAFAGNIKLPPYVQDVPLKPGIYGITAGDAGITSIPPEQEYYY